MLENESLLSVENISIGGFLKEPHVEKSCISTSGFVTKTATKN